MKTMIAKFAIAGLTALATAACNADVHDNTVDVHDNNANIDDAQVEISTSVDTGNVQPSQSVPLTIVAEDVFLIAPGSEPPPDRVMVAGHFQIYFDSMSSEPVLVTAEKSVSVTIPADATPGEHKLICRVHRHDGTPTQATFELSLTVTAAVST